ncbi:MAG: hypothetical protein H5T72_10080 [Actinobacteria bacterium]|nr:hypothetical protein [Actinomycetota bacterium]
MRGPGIDPGPLTSAEWEDLHRESRRVLELNEVEEGDVYYHMPSFHHYSSLFGWDSGFHAVAMLHIDPRKAARELETLFRQVREDGHLPHEVLLPHRTSHPWLNNLKTWLVRWEFDRRGASYMIDPPSYHYAAELVYERTRDRDWLGRLWPNMCRSLDYLLEERDVFGNGLVTIFHPWESGTDMSPQFFSAMGLDRGGLKSLLRSDLYPTALFAYNRAMGWDPQRLAKADRFVCQELTVNCLAIRACRSMAFLAGEIGEEVRKEKYEQRAARLMEALDALCWDEEAGCYFPRFGFRRPRLARRKTADSLMPLFGGLCIPERAARLIEDHLLNPREFFTPYPIPFNPVDEVEKEGGWVEKRLWAGHCVWVNFCWMLCIALDEHGYRDVAREITRRVVRMILREGFFEFYDSRTGEGRRIPDFCWPALALDMTARFWPEVIREQDPG